MSKMTSQKITNKKRFDEILLSDENELVIVNLSATWCGPCKQIAPHVDALAQKYMNKNVKIIKIDVDEAPDIAGLYQDDISGIPAFIFYKQGKAFSIINGANLPAITKTLSDYFVQLEKIIPEVKPEIKPKQVYIKELKQLDNF
ncbi:MAG: putative thioredoxin [Edafosvirus sp.]|uniref:Putative thioredoxin n=1 Tax=Edafosvirus sp. TaxID=2487765 RepID=A0A3G4ZUH6_9VIRU|nr:MAG: putative thioredoxin [Edafosvirus sp.]